MSNNMTSKMPNEMAKVARRENSKSMRWGMQLLYRREWNKSRIDEKKFKIGFFFIFALILGVTLLYSSDSEHYIKDTRLDSLESNGTRSITLPSFEEYMRQPKKNAHASRTAIKPSKILIFNRSTGLEIPPGTEVRAKLVTGATDGLVKAVLLEDVTHSGESYLPERTILIGTGATQDDRLHITFTSAVLENGSTSLISGMAYDASSKLLGLTGSIVTRKVLKIAAAAGLNFVAGASQGMQSTQFGMGLPYRPASAKNALLNGASTAALEESKDLINSMKDKQSVVYVDQGTDLVIVFQGGQQ